jgi:hypothetical protein
MKPPLKPTIHGKRWEKNPIIMTKNAQPSIPLRKPQSIFF